jgi:hypothetical protein
MEIDTTILEAGTGDSPNPRSDDDDKLEDFSLQNNPVSENLEMATSVLPFIFS